MGAEASKGFTDFGNSFVNTLTGGINVVTGALGIPEIPLVNPDDPSPFGHGNQQANQQEERDRQERERQRQQALEQIATIKITSITIPDIKQTSTSQNFSLPPPIQVKGAYVDKEQLQKAQEEAVLQQSILLGSIGIGGLVGLYLLKKA